MPHGILYSSPPSPPSHTLLILCFLTQDDSFLGGKTPYLYFQFFQCLISRNKQRFLPSDFPVPGASPDALLLVSDVALVRDLLALRTTVSLETRGKNQEPKFWIGGKYNLPLPWTVFRASWSHKGRHEVLKSPFKSKPPHASTKRTKGLCLKPWFLLLMLVWGGLPAKRRSHHQYLISPKTKGWCGMTIEII